MIRSAAETFLSLPRDDLRYWKRLTDDEIVAQQQQLGTRPPIWSKLLRHQRICFLLGVKYKRFAFWCDTGCVAGETLIETAQGPQRIDKLAREGRALRVWSLTTTGLKLVEASAPFSRGPTQQFEITFSDGRHITVTGKHRFLTTKGWVTCADLVSSSKSDVCLPLFDVSHPQSNPESAPLIPLVGDRHCKQTTPSYQASSPPKLVSVISVKAKGVEVYYDLHVPIHENYIAHGLCHHNTGKTLISLALIRYFREVEHIGGVALVLVPTKAVKTDWINEIAKHAAALKAVILEGSSAKKWKLLESDGAHVFIETYDGLVRMCSDLVPNYRKPGKQRLMLDHKLVRKLGLSVDGLILDESTEVANAAALPFRTARMLVASSKYVFALSGTPFGRDPIALWAQMFLIDDGQTLGVSKLGFRSAMFKATFNGFAQEYHFIDKHKPVLNRILAHRSIRFKAAATDLPEVVRIVKSVPLSDEALGFVSSAKATLFAAAKQRDKIATRNAFMRLRQLSSGFVGFFDEARDERSIEEFEEKPKLALLLALVQSIRGKIVVFVEFNFSGALISRELTKLSIEHERMWGGTKDPTPIRQRFDDDERLRVLILSNAYGGFGLNLQVAQYGIYFESPVSAIIRKQTERRIERQHSEHAHVFLYDLVSSGTFDERILKWHVEGGNLLQAIIDGDKNALLEID
jgi:superfamily II DNA or RNA helicase